jgi:hypothetical protein
MPFIFNGTTITDVVFNGVIIDTVFFNGVEVFKSFNPLLFEGQTENTSFVQGFNTGGSNAITEDYFDGIEYVTRISVPGITGVSDLAWVTDVTVDLTNYSSIEITWSQVGDANNNASSRLCVSSNKTADSNTFDARLSKANIFSKVTETLDISGLSGSYYIRVHARDNSTIASVNSIVHVYKIELIP